MTLFDRLKSVFCRGLAVVLVLLGVWGMGGAIAQATPLLADLPPNLYQTRTFHRPDGTGKFYMGREIATYMSHTGAAWLERPSREAEETPSQLVDALNLQPTDVVADIGAGTGYVSFRISPKVPEGRVLAVDIQPEMLDMLNFFKDINAATNVETILGEPDNPHLPSNAVDLAIFVDAYHEFEYPYEMMSAVVESLKPGGRVALIEYRGEDWLLPIKRLHKMTEKQARREMQAVGLVWQETLEFLPQQHLMMFAKPMPPAA